MGMKQGSAPRKPQVRKGAEGGEANYRPTTPSSFRRWGVRVGFRTSKTTGAEDRKEGTANG
jgi:hypothetical protein